MWTNVYTWFDWPTYTTYIHSMVNGVLNLCVGGGATSRMADIYLPPTMVRPFNHMLRPELESWVSGILSKETGKSRITDYTKVVRPQWWPESVPFSNPSRDPRKGHARLEGSWSDNLRTVLRSYYVFHRQCSVLEEEACSMAEDNDSSNPWSTDQTVWRGPASDDEISFKVYNMMDGSVVDLPDDSHDHQKATYASSAPMEAAVPGNDMSAAGPLPARIFKHAQSPGSTSLEGSSARISPSEAASAAGEHEVKFSSKHDVVEVFICFFCEREFGERCSLQQHQQYCTMRPAEFVAVSRLMPLPRPGLRSQSRPKIFQIRRSRVKHVHPDTLPRPEKTQIIDALALLPRANAEKLKRQRRKVHVENIKIEVETPKSPSAPLTPKTPKSLMSQLSRDASPLGRMKSREAMDMGSFFENERDSDDESVTSSTDVGYQPRRVASLFNIDLTSALGQRVKKLLVPTTTFDSSDSDESEDEGNNKHYEKYCRTPVKSGQLSKLRHRGNQFPVTFRKTKRTAPSNYFRYAFTARDRHEHYRVLVTGLNKRGRALKRQLTKCSLRLKRLTEAELSHWRKRKVIRSPEPYADLLSMSNHSSPAVSGKSNLTMYNAFNTPSHNELFKKMLQRVNSRPRPAMRLLRPPGSDRPTLAAPRPAAPVQPSSPAKPSPMRQQPLLLRDMLQNPDANCTYKAAQTPVAVTPSPKVKPPPLVKPSPQVRLTSHVRLSPQVKPSPQGKPSPHVRPSPQVKPSPQGKQSPQRLPKSSPSDEVISISSSDEDDEVDCSNNNNKRTLQQQNRPQDQPMAKRRRIEELRAQPLMFRCHLCQAEITCKENATVIIKRHFTKSHQVYNIDLLEHTDPSGQRVISIVELPRNHIPTPRPAATPLPRQPQPEYLSALLGQPVMSPAVAPSQFCENSPSKHVTNVNQAHQRSMQNNLKHALQSQSLNNNNNDHKKECSRPSFAPMSSYNQQQIHNSTTRARRGLFQERESFSGPPDKDCNSRRSHRLHSDGSSPRPHTRSNGKVEVICLD